MSLGSTMKQNPLLWLGIAYLSGTSAFGPLRRYLQTVSVLEGTVLYDGAGKLPMIKMEASENSHTTATNTSPTPGKSPMVCFLRNASGKQVLNRILSSV